MLSNFLVFTICVVLPNTFDSDLLVVELPNMGLRQMSQTHQHMLDVVPMQALLVAGGRVAPQEYVLCDLVWLLFVLGSLLHDVQAQLLHDTLHLLFLLLKDCLRFLDVRLLHVYLNIFTKSRCDS